ncbi:MAG: hypothetical protein IKK43_03835 [Clostridia bacterium]|nr:hypothetical protein [Clostridia bacterium]
MKAKIENNKCKVNVKWVLYAIWCLTWTIIGGFYGDYMSAYDDDLFLKFLCVIGFSIVGLSESFSVIAVPVCGLDFLKKKAKNNKCKVNVMGLVCVLWCLTWTIIGGVFGAKMVPFSGELFFKFVHVAWSSFTGLLMSYALIMILQFFHGFIADGVFDVEEEK